MDESSLYGQQNLTLPHDVVTLPSGGVFYKNKKKSLKVGYLTASDENILLGDRSKDGMIMTLLKNKIYEPDIKPNDLLPGDVEAVLIFLRNTSFGPEYNITLTDNGTGNKFETTILLDELDFRKPEVSPNNDGTFSVQLPKTNKPVKIKPLTMGELFEIDKLAESYPQSRVAPKQTWRLEKMIVEIDGNSDREFISNFIISMPIMDSKYIKRFIDDNEPRLDLIKKVQTPSGELVDVNVSFGVEFFRPFF